MTRKYTITVTAERLDDWTRFLIVEMLKGIPGVESVQMDNGEEEDP